MAVEPFLEVPDCPEINKEAPHLQIPHHPSRCTGETQFCPTKTYLDTGIDEGRTTTYIGVAVSLDVKESSPDRRLELLGGDDVLPLEPLGDKLRRV